jgi:hypothetical protein
MAEMREAKSESSNKRGSYKKIHHIEIEPVKGEHGGHMVTHHYQAGTSMMPPPPQVHMFGKEDGAEMMDHLAKHLKVSLPEAHEQQTAEPGNEVESASEPASEDVEA